MNSSEGLAAVLISAVVSIAVVVLNNHLQFRLARDQRELDAKSELDLLREPLILAAKNLSDRIRNLQNRGFIQYIRGPAEHRRKIALIGTLYRFAAYWAVQEQLYQRVNLLRFEENSSTKGTSERLRAVSSRFASDRSGDLVAMVWRDEQRAIGQLMTTGITTEGAPVMLGLASFIDAYDNKFSYWMGNFCSDIQQATIVDNDRLREVADLLDDLVLELERAKPTER